MRRNPCCRHLVGHYLFPEIERRKQEFCQNHHPEASLISLGIGDTTQPLPKPVSRAMAEMAMQLGEPEGYRGYGSSQGNLSLREKIASIIYQGRVEADEIFISDGSKCDIGRLQLLFGSSLRIGVQDPSYPVYVDGSVLSGGARGYDPEKKRYQNICYLPCTPTNNFFPSVDDEEEIDLLYLCLPNNPTGTVLNRTQVRALLDSIKKKKIITVLDTAYAEYIQEHDVPKTWYEWEEAKSCVIETGSFSKMAGFTGVRLGWVVVPKAVRWEDGSSLYDDWARLHGTIFNGASNIAQAGGEAVLDRLDTEIRENIAYYLENARLLRQFFLEQKISVFGGVNAPFVWASFPEFSSWEAFQWLLEKAHLVTTPGSGFGPHGEGFIRFSAFGTRESLLRAIDRLQNLLKHPTLSSIS